MVKTLLTTILFPLVLCATLLSTRAVHAFEPHIDVSISPAYPRPGETVTVSLSSYAVDLDRATITWYVDGVLSDSAPGMTILSLPVSSAGETTSIRTTISIGNAVYEKFLSVTPQSIDLLWEASQTYTPPFYKGKALPASGAFVKVIAVPHITTQGGARISENNLVYTWSRNNFKRDVQSQSGYGKSTLTMKKNILLPAETIAVEALSQSGTLGASAAISIPEVDPEIILYEEHPALGVRFHEALADGAVFEDRETVLRAEPYFFSTYDLNRSSLSYDWSVGGVSVPSHWSNPGDLAIDVPEGTTGNTAVSLSITSPEYILQAFSETLSIIFGETQKTFFQ